MNGTSIHDDIRARLADNEDLDGETIDHLAGCATCRAWHQRLGLLREAAPSIFEPDAAPDLTDRVIAAATQDGARTSRRWPPIAAIAAAITAVVLAGAIFVVGSRSGGSTDRLDAVADQYETTGQLRWVYESSATVVVADDSAVDARPVALQPLPICPDTAVESAPATSIDLQPAIDAVLGNDPCAALAAVRADIGAAAQQTASELAETAAQWDQRADTLTATSVTGTPLQQQSALTLADEARAQANTLTTALQALTAAHEQASSSLQPFVEAAEAGTSTAALQPVVQRDLQALVELIDNAPTNTPPSDQSVEWSLLSTGTWTTTGTEVSGTVETGNGEPVAFDSVADDPMQLVAVLFADPASLLALLRSAPSGDGDTVVWDVPDGVLTADAYGPWTATATFDGDRFERLTLTTRSVATEQISVTFTPAR